MKEQLAAIVNNYGIIPQLKYFQSEVFELNEAIIKKEEDYQFCETTVKMDEENRNNIVEEIADVQVMLNQFKVFYGITDEDIQSVMQYKINRQLERIKEENKNGNN